MKIIPLDTDNCGPDSSGEVVTNCQSLESIGFIECPTSITISKDEVEIVDENEKTIPLEMDKSHLLFTTGWKHANHIAFQLDIWYLSACFRKYSYGFKLEMYLPLTRLHLC